MDTFMKSDIFFFVTTIAVILLTLLLLVLLAYIIKIAKNVKYISDKAKNEAGLIAQDLSDLRQNVKDNGAKLKYFISFFNNLGKKK